MIKKTKFRMSTPVVVIGFVLLVPSVLGILFGALMLIMTAVTGHRVSGEGALDIKVQLIKAGITEPTLSKVASNRTLDSDEIAELTPEQLGLVKRIQSGVAGEQTAMGCMGGFSVLIMILSFVGGIGGWLLVMWHQVLQCERCGAVVRAS